MPSCRAQELLGSNRNTRWRLQSKAAVAAATVAATREGIKKVVRLLMSAIAPEMRNRADGEALF